MMEYTIFGESHGPAVGVLIQNVPAGLPVDDELIHADLLRRRASGALATGRHEPDKVELLSGVYQGRTTGDAPEVDGCVCVSSEEPLYPGQFYDVLVEDSDLYDLYGTVVK